MTVKNTLLLYYAMNDWPAFICCFRLFLSLSPSSCHLICGLVYTQLACFISTRVPDWPLFIFPLYFCRLTTSGQMFSSLASFLLFQRSQPSADLRNCYGIPETSLRWPDYLNDGEEMMTTITVKGKDHKRTFSSRSRDVCTKMSRPNNAPFQCNNAIPLMVKAPLRQ